MYPGEDEDPGAKVDRADGLLILKIDVGPGRESCHAGK